MASFHTGAISTSTWGSRRADLRTLPATSPARGSPYLALSVDSFGKRSNPSANDKWTNADRPSRSDHNSLLHFSDGKGIGRGRSITTKLCKSLAFLGGALITLGLVFAFGRFWSFQLWNTDHASAPNEAAQLQLDADSKFLTYLPVGAFSWQLLGFQCACAMAVAQNRILVLPLLSAQSATSIPADGSSEDLASWQSNWAPIERYFQLSLMRSMPCKSVTASAFRKWLKAHLNGSDHGKEKEYTSSPEVLYQTMAGNAPVSLLTARTYYTFVLGSVFDSSNIWNKAAASVRNSNSSILAYGSLVQMDALTDDANCMQRIWPHLEEAEKQAADVLLAPDTAKLSHGWYRDIFGRMHSQKRVMETARRARVALLPLKYAAIHAWRSAEGRLACSHQPTENARGSCLMPTAVAVAALDDLRRLLSTIDNPNDEWHINQPRWPSRLVLYSADAGTTKDQSFANNINAISDKESRHPVAPVGFPVDVDLFIWTDQEQEWVPHLRNNDAAVVFTSTLEAQLAGTIGHDLVPLIAEFNLAEHLLLNAELAIGATWYIGNPYSALSRFVMDRRVSLGRPSFFLPAESLYGELA